MDNNNSVVLVITALFVPSLALIIFGCLCWGRRSGNAKDELFGVEGRIHSLNSNNNDGHVSVVGGSGSGIGMMLDMEESLSLKRTTSIPVGAGAEIGGQRTLNSTNSLPPTQSRQLPALPLRTNSVLSAGSDLYASVADYNKSNRSNSDSETYSTANPYAKLKGSVEREHPYAKVKGPGHNTNTNTTQAQTNGSTPGGAVASTSGTTTAHAQITASSSISTSAHAHAHAPVPPARRRSSSSQLQALVPHVAQNGQQEVHFSGDSAGYTSISVREPLATLAAQRQVEYTVETNNPPSEDSESMYAAIEDNYQRIPEVRREANSPLPPVPPLPTTPAPGPSSSSTPHYAQIVRKSSHPPGEPANAAATAPPRRWSKADVSYSEFDIVREPPPSGVVDEDNYNVIDGDLGGTHYQEIGEREHVSSRRAHAYEKLKKKVKDKEEVEIEEDFYEDIDKGDNLYAKVTKVRKKDNPPAPALTPAPAIEDLYAKPKKKKKEEIHQPQPSTSASTSAAISPPHPHPEQLYAKINKKKDSSIEYL